MRWRLLVALVALFALVAAACGDDDDTETGDESPPEETDEATDGDDAGDEATDEAGDEEATGGGTGDGLQIAAIYDGPIDDGGWNTSHAAGVAYMAENLPDAEITEVEDVAPGDAVRASLTDFAEQGYDLVIGTTFFQDDVLAVAADYPDTVFLTWGGIETADNVGQFSLATEDGRYLDGLIAGSVTETNKIGYPAGFAIPEVVRGINAFARGALEVNPDVEIVPVYTNSWFDPPTEQQAAESLVNDGVDILAHELNSPATASVAERAGIFSIGYGWDQSERSPNGWLTSFTFDWGPYYLSQAEAVADGTWEPGVYYGGIAEGVVGMSPFGEAVPDDVIELVETRYAEIADGTFDVLAGPFEDNEGNVVIADGETIPLEERAACCDWYAPGVSGSVPTS